MWRGRSGSVTDLVRTHSILVLNKIARCQVLCAQQASCMGGILNEAKEVSAALKLRGV